MTNQSKVVRWLGIVIILIIGLIHVIDAPHGFEEATYKGWLFCANGIGSLAAAYGIYQKRSWGWSLGLVIAIGSLAGYVLSRTVGLPQIPAEPDEWLEPLGVTSVIAEIIFILILFIKVSTNCCCKSSQTPNK